MTSTRYVCKLSEKEKLLAKEELNETDENRSEKIDEIRQWLLDSPKLISRTDDFYILRFLRVSKFDVEKTKGRIRKYLEFKTDCPEWFTNRGQITQEIQEIIDLGIFLPLRKFDDKNRMVLIDRSCYDPKRHSFDALLKVGMATLELAMRDNEALTLNGAVALIDAGDSTFAHAFLATPNDLKRMAYVAHNCQPIRIKSYDFVNVPWYLTFLVKVYKTFLSEKLRNRFFIHSDDKTILDKFPKEILPVEYGGSNGSIDDLRDYWKEQMEKNLDWLIDDEKYKMLK